MKNVLIGLVIVLFILGLSGCKSQKIQSHWTDETIVVNGENSDWENLPINEYEKINSFMGVTNDSNNLSIMINFNDQSLYRQFQTSGITLWFNVENKKKKKYGLRLTPERNTRDRRNETENRMTAERRQMMEQRQKQTLTGLSYSTNGGVFFRVERGDNSPIASHKNTAGITNIEFQIPLNAAASSFAVGAKPGDVINFGIEIGSALRPDGRRVSISGGGMGGRSGGRGGKGGSMGNRGGGMGGGTQKSANQHKEIWFSLKLADNKKDN